MAKLEGQLAGLKAQKSEDSPADDLRTQIQQLTADLEYGNLSEAEYAQLKECREELRECAADLKAAQAAAAQKPEDIDGKIGAAQEKIKTLKKLIANVAIYVSERAKLTFSALKMNKVETSLYDIVKTTGERKDVFKFTYGGRRYNRLSLSEKIQAGMEVSRLAVKQYEKIPIVDAARRCGMALNSRTLKHREAYQALSQEDKVYPTLFRGYPGVRERCLPL